MRRLKEKLILIFSLIVLDSFSILTALGGAYYLYLESNLFAKNSPVQRELYGYIITRAIPLWLLIFAFFRLYDSHYLLGGPQEYAQVVKACTFGAMGIVVYAFLAHTPPLSRGWFTLSWLFSIIIVGTARFFFRRLIYRLRRRGLYITRALIIGANEQGKAIAEQLHPPENSGVEVIGFLDDYLPPQMRIFGDLRVLGTPAEVDKIASEYDVDDVIVVPEAITWESFREILNNGVIKAKGYTLKLSPGLYGILATGVQVSYKNFVPLITVERMRITGIDAILKNLLDYGLGGLLTFLSLPLMLFIAITIKLSNGGPVFERHKVLGAGGTLFETLKFKTGLTGTPRSLAPNPLAVSPPRATYTFGRFLYKTGLDKLPQLFNVLGGKMSLVGPRTISVDNSALHYRWFPSLLTVKPGITGPWVVAPGERSFEEEMRLNMYYIRNWTIWLDLQILYQTIRLMLQRGFKRGEKV